MSNTKQIETPYGTATATRDDFNTRIQIEVHDGFTVNRVPICGTFHIWHNGETTTSWQSCLERVDRKGYTHNWAPSESAIHKAHAAFDPVINEWLATGEMRQAAAEVQARFAQSHAAQQRANVKTLRIQLAEAERALVRAEKKEQEANARLEALTN